MDADPLADAEIDSLLETDWLLEVDAAVESLVDVDAGAADSLVEPEADVGAADSLVDVDVDADAGAAESDGAADWLVVCETDCETDCDVDSVVDSESDSLVAAPLPGVRTALPSVASVLSCAALASYDMGVISDMYL